MTKLCFSPSEAYVIVWRRRLHGKRYGSYRWLTPASVRRLLSLTNGPLWRRTHRVGSEHYLEQVTI